MQFEELKDYKNNIIQAKYKTLEGCHLREDIWAARKWDIM